MHRTILGIFQWASWLIAIFALAMTVKMAVDGKAMVHIQSMAGTAFFCFFLGGVCWFARSRL